MITDMQKSQKMENQTIWSASEMLVRKSEIMGKQALWIKYKT